MKASFEGDLSPILSRKSFQGWFYSRYPARRGLSRPAEIELSSLTTVSPSSFKCFPPPRGSRRSKGGYGLPNVDEGPPMAAASVRADDSVGFIFIASLMLHVLSRRKIPPRGKATLCTLPTSLLYDRAARWRGEANRGLAVLTFQPSLPWNFIRFP